jgi:hypothetical protein
MIPGIFVLYLNLNQMSTKNTPMASPPATPTTSIPDAVSALIKSTSTLGIYNVTGNEIVLDQIIKCDQIVFDSDSSITLKGLTNFDFVVILARQWKLSTPNTHIFVMRDKNVFPQSGTPGQTGIAGAPGTGAGGAKGGNGGPGGSLKVGKLYLLGEDFILQSGVDITNMKVVIDISGIGGGAGGIGGTGGTGASGNQGQNNSAPGNGGDGGPGGIGGNGGSGSDGGVLSFIGTQKFLDIISWASVNNDGGSGGAPGMPGTGGLGGAGGVHENNVFSYTTAPPGRQGMFGQPGSKGVDGKKGLTNAYPVPNLNNIV